MNWKAKILTLLMVGTLLTPAAKTYACAWSEDWESDFYRFYEPEFDHLAEFKPFNFTFDRLYDYALLDDTTSHTANLQQWQRYLGPKIKAKDIEVAVYNMTADELTNIKSNPSGNVAKGYLDNSLVAEWQAGRRIDVLDYLIMAHKAEPFCLYDDPWGEEERVMDGIEYTISLAKAASKANSDPFLKLRYAYQTVRLEQYSGQYEMAIETYRQLALPFAAADPLIAQWAQCHYAGCLRNIEMEADAAYQFSRVFDQCPSRRVQAWYGWRIMSDDIWETVQAKCKNNHEMATVYFLRGYASNADPIEDMRQMQELDPGSKMIEVLMLREINKIENEVLSYPFSADSPLSKRLGSDSNARELQNFVREVMASGKMYDRSAWQLAHTYLYFLLGDLAQASSELKEKQASLSAEGQLKAKLMDLVFRIAAVKAVDRSVENTIFKDFTNLSEKLTEDKAEELKRFRDEAFAWLYEAQGEKAKALLARRQGWRINETPIDIELINDMLAFEAKSDKTLYEKELLKGLGEEANRKNTLLEIKGTGLMAKNLIPEAIKVFQQLPQTYRGSSPTFSLAADPFRPVITDVVNCEDCGAGKFDKLSYAEAMIDLQKKVLTDPSKAAEYNLLIGNAYYNTSYFGASWNALDYYRSGGGWYYLGQKDEYYNFDVATFDEVVDMSHAKEFFTKALKASKDKEMAALAAFMIGKCELNQYYIDGAETMSDYYTGFKTLKEEYKKTAVYKSLIKECMYLRDYVSIR